MATSRATLGAFVRLVPLVLFVLLVLFAPALASAADDAARVAAGKALFERNCATCHGVAGDGKGPVAPALSTPPADLTRLYERFGTPLAKSAVAELIDGRRVITAHGTTDMPVWGKQLFGDLSASPAKDSMTRGTVAQIVDYLASIQRQP